MGVFTERNESCSHAHHPSCCRGVRFGQNIFKSSFLVPLLDYTLAQIIYHSFSSKQDGIQCNERLFLWNSFNSAI